MRKSLLLPALALAAALLTACSGRSTAPDTLPAAAQRAQEETAAPSPAPSVTGAERTDIEAGLTGIAGLCREAYERAESAGSPYFGEENNIAQADIDAMEDILIAAGLPVVNSDGFYPDYVENSGPLRAFIAAALRGEDAAAGFWGVSRTGGIYYRGFLSENGGLFRIFAAAEWVSGELVTDYIEKRALLGFGETEDGFYYQDIHTDPHWDAAKLVRLSPADPELYALCRRYILPVGYQGVNLFLIDWETGSWNGLAFNDLFDCLYRADTGEFVYARDYPYSGEPYPHNDIPAELFEKTVYAHFDISLSDFRTLALYDGTTDSYPWQDIYGGSIPYFPSLIPEVTGVSGLEDGALALTVNVMCLDLGKTSLFTHEVRVRPLADGGFVYLGNRILSRGAQLPSSLPRLPALRGQ